MKKLCFAVLLSLYAIAGHAQVATGNISAAGSSCIATTCVNLPFPSIQAGTGAVTITVSANASANTLQFEATGDGTTYAAINSTPLNSTTAVTSTTSTGTWQLNVAGLIGVRVRCSTFVGGTSTVTIQSSTASARLNGGSGGGGDTITSPNATLGVGGNTTNTTLDVLGAAGEILAGATPALTYSPTLGAVGHQGTLSIAGTTSGTLAVTTQAVAGTPTWTAGTSSGTPAVTASSPLAITSATGNATCATCAIGPGSSTANHLAKFSGTDGVTLVDGGVAGAGTVTSIATTTPVTGGTITGTGTIACPTCNTSAGALTSTAIVTGAGLQAEQTPSATSTLDSSGNMSLPGTLAATGHTTFEGVTSTGATGTGKLVYDTSPILVTPNLGTPSAINLTNATAIPFAQPTYSTAQTGISMIAGTGTITTICTSGVCTMTTPAADGRYRIGATLQETTAGSAGTCTTGSVRMEMGYRDAVTSVTYATSNTIVGFSTVNTPNSVLSTMPMTSTAPGANNAFIAVEKVIYAKAGTAITYQLDQTAGSNCTTPPVFAIYPYLYGPLGF